MLILIHLIVMWSSITSFVRNPSPKPPIFASGIWQRIPRSVEALSNLLNTPIFVSTGKQDAVRAAQFAHTILEKDGYIKGMIEGYFKKEDEGTSPKFLFAYAGADEEITYIVVLDQYGDTVNTYIDYNPPANNFGNVKMLWRSAEIENCVEGNQLLNLFIFGNLYSTASRNQLHTLGNYCELKEEWSNNEKTFKYAPHYYKDIGFGPQPFSVPIKGCSAVCGDTFITKNKKVTKIHCLPREAGKQVMHLRNSYKVIVNTATGMESEPIVFGNMDVKKPSEMTRLREFIKF